MLAVLGDGACALEIGTVLVYADEVESKAIRLEEAVDKFQAEGGNVMAIKNRYYSANVTVTCVDVVSAAESGQMSGVDACVVVNPSDLSALSALLADHDFGTRLMVRLLDGPEVEEEEGGEDESPSELLLWCLDNGFELVTADRSDLFATWSEREKDGLARVVEALQPTMWTGMAKADPTTVTAGMNGGVTGGGGSSVPLAGMESSSSTDDVDSAAAAPAPAPAPASEANAASPLTTQGGADPLDFEELVKAAELSGAQGQEEKFDTVFTSFMDEARRVRVAAMSGDVPDAVRRDQAAKIAAQMATFMGFDDDDDEDDSD